MKGAEERDIMFGKLFNYLTLIRAGKIHNDSTTALYIVDRLIELHKRKVWIREVVSETILLLFEVFPKIDSIFESAIQKLKFIIDVEELDETPPHDLILLSGLQNLSMKLNSEGYTKISSIINQILPSETIFTPENFSVLENTLLNACHGFPKV